MLLIDGDIVNYRCAASVEPSKKLGPIEFTEEENNRDREIAIARVNTLMRELLHTTQADTYQCFVSGRNNFRYRVNPEYKANRKDTVDPRFRTDCKTFLINEWNAQVSTGCEADDILGIAQTEDSIIASIDKDLLMIPGWHYNWVKDERTYTTPLDGIRFLYKQMLIGDKADNIFGVDGLGPVKSTKLIDHLETEEEMIEVVYNLYNQNAKRFVQNAMCLWILQEEGITWAHRAQKQLILNDQLGQEVARILNSTKFSMDDISTEPIMNPQKTFGIPLVGTLPESMEIKT
jgi:5'-3' exonuclease